MTQTLEAAGRQPIVTDRELYLPPVDEPQQQGDTGSEHPLGDRAHVCQYENGTDKLVFNDCGPATVVMLIRAMGPHVAARFEAAVTAWDDEYGKKLHGQLTTQKQLDYVRFHGGTYKTRDGKGGSQALTIHEVEHCLVGTLRSLGVDLPDKAIAKYIATVDQKRPTSDPKHAESMNLVEQFLESHCNESTAVVLLGDAKSAPWGWGGTADKSPGKRQNVTAGGGHFVLVYRRSPHQLFEVLDPSWMAPMTRPLADVVKFAASFRGNGMHFMAVDFAALGDLVPTTMAEPNPYTLAFGHYAEAPAPTWRDGLQSEQDSDGGPATRAELELQYNVARHPLASLFDLRQTKLDLLKDAFQTPDQPNVAQALLQALALAAIAGAAEAIGLGVVAAVGTIKALDGVLKDVVREISKETVEGTARGVIDANLKATDGTDTDPRRFFSAQHEAIIALKTHTMSAFEIDRDATLAEIDRMKNADQRHAALVHRITLMSQFVSATNKLTKTIGQVQYNESLSAWFNARAHDQLGTATGGGADLREDVGRQTYLVQGGILPGRSYELTEGVAYLRFEQVDDHFVVRTLQLRGLNNAIYKDLRDAHVRLENLRIPVEVIGLVYPPDAAQYTSGPGASEYLYGAGRDEKGKAWVSPQSGSTALRYLRERTKTKTDESAAAALIATFGATPLSKAELH